MSFQLCSLWSLERFLRNQEVVQSSLNMCLYGVCPLILTEPHTDQTLESNQEIQPYTIHPPYYIT